ncbi:MAG: RNA pseudouridine synthase [Saprospiraceae bacterium]
MNWIPHILYEDNHYIAISKPFGYTVQPEGEDQKAIIPLLQDFIGKRDKKPGKAFIGVLHRLDKSVTGVLILSKTSKGQERFNELLKNKKVTKYYLALTERSNIPQEGTLIHYFSRRNEDYKMTVSTSRHSHSDHEAILKYHILSIIDDYQLWAIELITGRRHQIRGQLAAIGSPILGDKRYGSHSVQDQIALHCSFMSFKHPIKHIPIEVKDTPDMNKIIWKSYKLAVLEWMRSL